VADGQKYKDDFHIGLYVVVVVFFGLLSGVLLNEENYFVARGCVGPTYFVLEGQKRK
jgi:hypothetical protein